MVFKNATWHDPGSPRCGVAQAAHFSYIGQAESVLAFSPYQLIIHPCDESRGESLRPNQSARPAAKRATLVLTYSFGLRFLSIESCSLECVRPEDMLQQASRPQESGHTHNVRVPAVRAVHHYILVSIGVVLASLLWPTSPRTKKQKRTSLQAIVSGGGVE